MDKKKAIAELSDLIYELKTTVDLFKSKKLQKLEDDLKLIQDKASDIEEHLKKDDFDSTKDIFDNMYMTFDVELGKSIYEVSHYKNQISEIINKIKAHYE